MIGNNPRIPDDVLLSASDGVFQTKSIHELQEFSFGITNFRYGTYHHLPAIGSHNFDQTNQFLGFQPTDRSRRIRKKKWESQRPGNEICSQKSLSLLDFAVKN